ncbi:MAG: Cof-type HAD-IIB family hydrolase [Spirochaetaceae bacterium]|jgi:Cof subfamily protein (haloacid dehalogenase superfamily)|nr:Cof-type HAD-IIB family hydrolase [Spirochaetaceae bacterium]
MTPVRLLAVDMDDTLPRSGNSVPFRVRSAVRKAGSRGITMALVSHWPPETLKQVSALMGIKKQPGCLIASSGTIVMESRAGIVLYEQKLPPAAALPVFDMADAEGFAVQIHGGDTMYISRANEFTGYGEKLTGLRQTVAGNFREMIAAGCHKLLIPGDPMILEPLARLLKTLSDDVAIHSPMPYLLEVLPSGANKAAALALAAEKCSVPREEVLAMGNSPDDAAMLRWAGYSVTTSSADPQLKEIASYVTEESSMEDCIAKVIEHFILGNGVLNGGK